MNPKTFKKQITDPNAPKRLQGKTITATLMEGALEIVVDMPENPDNQEMGYVRWATGELVDSLREYLPKGMVGDVTMGLIKDDSELE